MQFSPAILSPCLPSDLDTLTFTEDTAAFNIAVNFYIDGVRAYRGVFYTPTREFKLRGVASLINDLTNATTPQLHTLSISYEKNGGAETYVIHGAKYLTCRKRLAKTGNEFFKTSFLTASAWPRETTVYSSEVLSWINADGAAESVNIVAEWLTGANDIITSSHLFTSNVTNGISSLDVSAYRFYSAKPAEAVTLLRYTVAVGNRRAVYTYDTTADSATQPRCLAFINLFGVTDTILLRGEIVRTDKPEYTSASVYGAVKNYDINLVPTFKGYTGRMPDTALGLLADAASSSRLWLADNPGTELTLTEADIENSSRYDGFVSGTLTWRESNTERLLIGGDSGRVFDEQFDFTFI